MGVKFHRSHPNGADVMPLLDSFCLRVLAGLAVAVKTE